MLIILQAFHTLCQSILALHACEAFHFNRLPHYDAKEIIEELGVLTLPYVCTSSTQPLLDALRELSLSQPSPHAFTLLRNNEERFVRLTRFSVLEFLLLYHELEAHILMPYSIPGRTPSATRSRLLHPIDQFLLWLFHGDGNDPDLLGVLFGDVSRSTVDRVADHVTRAVNEV